MELVALPDDQEINATFEQLKQHLRRGAKECELVVGTPAGLSSCTAYWHPREKLWAVLELEGRGNTYWCCYGVDDPAEKSRQAPVMQINPPVHAANWRPAGAFARDPKTGRVYYVHDGRINNVRNGQARLRIGRSLEKVDIVWPGGQRDQRYVVGRLGDRHLVANIAAYAHAVRGFREAPGSLEAYYRNAIMESVGESLRTLQRELDETPARAEAGGEAGDDSVRKIRIERLKDLRKWLLDDPQLLQSTVDTLTKKEEHDRTRRLLFSVLGAAASIGVGWLLSAFRPDVVFSQLLLVFR